MTKPEADGASPHIEIQKQILNPEQQEYIGRDAKLTFGTHHDFEVSSQLLVSQEDDPQSAEALGGIYAIGKILTRPDEGHGYRFEKPDKSYQSVTLLTLGDESDRPAGLAFVSDKLPANQIETVQGKILQDINNILAKVGSPYRA